MKPARRRLRLVALGVVALFPGFIKRSLYRWLFGYRIAGGVRIGLSVLDAGVVHLAEGARIGHLNLITGIDQFTMGEHAHVDYLNIIRGGTRVELGRYATVMRFNVLNAIPDHDCTTNPISTLTLADGAMVVSGHRIDFTDSVALGRNVIVGGRSSSLWTHNRQETAPIVIGDFCYLGSEIRIAPGGRLAAECILALGAVLTGEIRETGSLVGGVPAKVLRPLGPGDFPLIRRKSRDDIPPDLY